MGLYNVVFGHDPQAPLVLALLNRKPQAFGRFRDAWFEKTAEGELRLVVYTRNGGGNRETEMPSFEDDPLYISDRDDDYDSTYAAIYFRMPTELPADVMRQITEEDAPDWINSPEKFRAKILEIARPPVDMRARWEKAIASIK